MSSSKTKSNEAIRFKFVILVFILVGIIWITQLYLIQIVDVYDFSEDRYRRATPKKEFIIPTRGNILDRNDELLVTTTKYYQVELHKPSARKRLGSDEAMEDYCNQVAELCSQVSSKSKKHFLKKLERTNPILFLKLVESKKDQLLLMAEENDIHDIVVTLSDYRRDHASDKTGLRLLGTARVSNDTILNTLPKYSKHTLEGLNGIEYAYNKELNGEFGWKEVYNDAKGQPLPKKGLQTKPYIEGQDIYLTIDFNLQREVEELLREAIVEHDSKAAMCTVMDPNTGEILVMAGIDRDELDKNENVIRGYANLPANYIFEPGSTFKPFTMLSALNLDVYDPESTIDCSLYVPDYEGKGRDAHREISDDHPKDFPLNGEQIIAYSSNVGIAKIAEKIGPFNLYTMLRTMGFGQKVPTPISQSVRGILASYPNWTQFSLHSISYGQEIGVTQLQLANAYCSLANGGYLLKPHIVKKIVDKNNNIIFESKREPLRKISRQGPLNIVRSNLEKVFEYGTARYFKNDIIKLAGKTGTAQSKNSKTKHTNKWDYSASFAGYFPADNPEYVIVVTFDKPKFASRYGSQSALPIFDSVMKKILYSKGSYTTEEFISKQKDFTTMPSLIGMTLKDAKIKLKNLDISYTTELIDDSQIIQKQFPSAGVVFPKNQRDVMIGAKQNIDLANNNVPNFKGKTIREAVDYCSHKSIGFQFKGSGLIYKQSVDPDTSIEEIEEIIFWCK